MTFHPAGRKYSVIDLLFSRRKHPGSWLIRTVTWSAWSHVELVLPGGQLIGAAAPHGVGLTPLHVRHRIASKVAVVSFPGDLCCAKTWAMEQLGKPYDWLGVLGLGLHRDWESDDSWWCSEFAAQALKQGGYAPFREAAINRITPEHLWMLNP